MSVALVGKDARTEALAAACERSPLEPRTYRPSTTDAVAVLAELRKDPPDLVLVGPEAPLCAGLADRLEDELGVPCFGPRQRHARIEGSKAWARELLAKHGIGGNPEHRVFRDPTGLTGYLHALGEFVIKPDGLTGGKGVKVSGEHLDESEGAEYARALIESDGVVVIEEKLDGEEFSLQTITDGRTTRHCPLVQDHKRAFEGDLGPNTGGMGSYTVADHSLPFVNREDMAQAQAINDAVVNALAAELGSPYHGVLYGGFMATGEGVKLIEYNARFGDPEATNVLSILASDLVAVSWAATSETLEREDVSFDQRATVCKYVVPEGYPTAPASGGLIDATDLKPLVGEGRVRLYWAAVDVEPGGWRARMTGSRALAVVGVGDSLEQAEQAAEEAAQRVGGAVRHRSDIGTAALLHKRVEHMEKLRS